MNIEDTFYNPSELIRNVRYEKEKSRYILALVIIFIFISAYISALFIFRGTEMLIDLIVNPIGSGLAALFLFWFVGKITKALLLMNLVEVNNKNFTELNLLINNAKATLEYDKPISAYILSGSNMWIDILHRFNRKIFIIESSFLEDNLSSEVLKFAIMFHIARLKTKSEYFSIFTALINGSEKLKFFNIFFYPFERATVYTADRVAMLYCGGIKYAQQALAREMIGTKLGLTVNFGRIAEQGIECRGFFAWLARAFSPMPGYSHRFVELTKFANATQDLMSDVDYEILNDSIFKLIPTDSQFQIIEIEDSQTITLGRDETNDIIIDDSYISSKHLIIKIYNNNIYISDLGSTNGTYIDGVKLIKDEETRLKTGEKLIVGSEKLVYQLSD